MNYDIILGMKYRELVFMTIMSLHLRVMTSVVIKFENFLKIIWIKVRLDAQISEICYIRLKLIERYLYWFLVSMKQ